MSKKKEILQRAAKLPRMNFDSPAYNGERFAEYYLQKEYGHYSEKEASCKLWGAANNLRHRGLTGPEYSKAIYDKAVEVDGITPEVAKRTIEKAYKYKPKYPPGKGSDSALGPEDLDDLF